MANFNGDGLKVMSDCGVFVLELFGPDKSPPKINVSIFDKPAIIERKKWPSDIGFMFSCIGVCASLGNIWRFPYVAIENGGGTFLIAYLTVFLLIGIPILYLEIFMGQFTSRGGARVFDCAPLLRGIGYAQVVITIIISTYYSAITSLSSQYVVSSISKTLPWSVSQTDWNESCVPSSIEQTVNYSTKTHSSAELFFRKTVMEQRACLDIFHVDLIIYLAVCWLAVTVIINKGLRILSHLGCFFVFQIFASLAVLLSQALTMPGGLVGVFYFVTPEWNRLLELQVWYAAITQIFFSVGICFGPIVMYSSFNKFSHNIFKDIPLFVSVNILVVLLAGSTFYAVVGNVALSHGLDLSEFTSRYSNNMFIVYSEVIAKFQFLPQITSAVFFLMVGMVGIGCISGLSFFIVQMIQDEFRIRKRWKIAIPFGIIGFILSNFYLIPVGEQFLNLLNCISISSPIFLVAILEVISFGWVYGVKRICDDIEFVFGSRTRLFWRISWFIKLPVALIGIFIYCTVYHVIHIINTDSSIKQYTSRAYMVGWALTVLIIIIIVIWTCYVYNRQPKLPFIKKIMLASRPNSNWGPSETSLLLNYRYFILKKENVSSG